MTLDRTCPMCKKVKSLTSDNFTLLDKNNLVFESFCKPCMKIVNTRIEALNKGNE